MIHIALVTTLILTSTVCYFLTALWLQLIYASLSAINVYAILSLVGIIQLYPSSILHTFGIKFGLSVVALPLVFYSRPKRTAREGLNIKFVASIIAKVTLDVKSWLVLIYTPASLSFGSLLK